MDTRLITTENCDLRVEYKLFESYGFHKCPIITHRCKMRVKITCCDLQGHQTTLVK